jgi:hypothetical protein
MKFLKDESDMTVSILVQLRIGEYSEVTVMKQDVSGVEVIQTSDHVQESRFTASAFAKDTCHPIESKLQ